MGDFEERNSIVGGRPQVVRTYLVKFRSIGYNRGEILPSFKLMTDPLSALTAGVIVDLAARKFIESGVGKLAEKFTESAIQKMGELWNRIKERLSGKSEKLDEALVKVEQGDAAAQAVVTKYLDVAMEDYPEFATEVKQLAQEIHAGKIQDNSSMVMNILGENATGYQTKNEVTVQGGESYTGNIIIHKYTTPPNP
jgi:Med18 protein